MEFIAKASIPVLNNSGIASQQLLFPENSNSTRVTITQVTMPPGKINPTHQHAQSEQIWIALSGNGTLLLGEGKTLAFAAGDVVRFEDGDTHGFHNTGETDFCYISVTSPPINFRAAYQEDWSGAIADEQKNA